MTWAETWKWLNERVIEVPEHGYDWLAPRWYVGVVILAYMAMAGIAILLLMWR